MVGAPVPVTIFTGYLGAGKTSVILNLVSQLPQAAAYNTVWLKNEFGDALVDSLLASSAGLRSKEVVNGCLCCVAVGHLADTLAELFADESIPRPDRILVETSGSAYPAPLAWQVRKAEASLPVVLDGVVTVVDCLNFEGYPDKSRAAKLQAEYTDLILLNKVDLLGDGVAAERKLDLVVDELVELNPDTPRVRLGTGGKVPIDLVFGLDSKVARLPPPQSNEPKNHMDAEVELLQYGPDSSVICTEKMLRALEGALDPDRTFRAKGSIRDSENPSQLLVFNCVAGRARIDRVPFPEGHQARFVFMGEGLKNMPKIVGPLLKLQSDSSLWQFTPRQKTTSSVPSTCRA